MNSEIKRLITALILVMAFMFVWSKFFGPKPVPAKPTQTTTQNETAPTATTTTQQSAKTANSTPVQPTNSVSNVETVEAKSQNLDATFSNQSGSIQSVQLLGYTKELKTDSPHISVVPLDQSAPSPFLWNLSFKNGSSNSSIAFDDHNTVYRWEEKTNDSISFSSMVNNQFKVTKVYHLKDGFVIEHLLRIQNLSSQPATVEASTSISAALNPNAPKPSFFSSLTNPQRPQMQALAYVRDEAIHKNFRDLPNKDLTVTDPSISWTGFSSQYFLLAALPVEGMWSGLKNGFENGIASMTMDYSSRNLQPNSSIDYVLKLYTGPKQIETLQSVHPTLDRSIQLGSWVGGLARSIHKLLAWIYKFIPNYGWAIIILTILVRLAVFPLAQMQARSMKKMALHKPAMDALKKKYENDKEAYSRELMAYMRTNKINPASGCLPLLIQFPVFIALYRVLYNSIELRHAPFGLWIHDLSAHDPFFVLPVLVGITFYLQTKLNPTPMADPAQQSMMKIMPIMFSVFMIFLPSGLNLYIFVSTLWGIVQQYMVQKSLTVK